MLRPWIRVRRTEYLISAMQPPPEPRRSYISPHHQRFPISYKNQHLSAIKPPSTSQAIMYKNAAIVVADADVMRHAPRDRRRKRSTVRAGCGQPSTVPVQDRMSSDTLLRAILQSTYWVKEVHVRYGGREQRGFCPWWYPPALKSQCLGRRRRAARALGADPLRPGIYYAAWCAWQPAYKAPMIVVVVVV